MVEAQTLINFQFKKKGVLKLKPSCIAVFVACPVRLFQ